MFNPFMPSVPYTGQQILVKISKKTQTLVGKNIPRLRLLSEPGSNTSLDKDNSPKAGNNTSLGKDYSPCSGVVHSSARITA